MTVGFRSGVVVAAIAKRVKAVVRDDSREGDADGSDVAVPAHLGNKTATGPKHAADLREHFILAADPVQYSIGKDSFEGVIGIG